MIPPIQPPVAARPVAKPRDVRNQWSMAEMVGVKRREKVRMKCQYSSLPSLTSATDRFFFFFFC